MEILNAPSNGLQSYPGQSIGPQIGQIGQDLTQTILTFAKIKKQQEDERAMRKLELYMKTGELTGTLEAPTPEIQKAFKKYYGVDPSGIFKTGGETLAGRKAKTEIKSTEADIKKKEQMANWYSQRAASAGQTDEKALTYAVKYANAKLGKPFEVLSEEERGLWQQYHDEALSNWSVATKKNGVKKDLSKFNNNQIAWMNRWNALGADTQKQALSDSATKAQLESELKAMGLTLEDISNV